MICKEDLAIGALLIKGNLYEEISFGSRLFAGSESARRLQQTADTIFLTETVSDVTSRNG